MTRIANLAAGVPRIVPPRPGTAQRGHGVTHFRMEGKLSHCKALAWVLAAAVTLALGACTGPDRGTMPTEPSALSAADGSRTALLENAPFSGRDSGTFEFLQAGCAAGVTPLRTHTTGTATLIGAHSFETQECFDTNTLTFTGSFTITAANGDTLIGSLEGNGTGVADDGTASYSFTAAITGGTGRFAGATGSFSGTGQGNLATFQESRSFSGTISGIAPSHS